MKQFKVLTIGDGLITMNPTTNEPLRFVNQFESKVGGAELNFAIGISRLGLYSKWISRLGNDEFGKKIINLSRGEGIDVTDVKLIDEYYTPLNFKEIRADGSGKTFYYRSNSPVLTLSKEELKEDIFSRIDVFHLSGVFLAVMRDKPEIIEHILKSARKQDVVISFDPNIRLKLWSIEQARNLYNKVLPYVDILLSGLDEIKLMENIDSRVELEAFAKKYKIRDLVIKDGAKGSLMYRDNQWTEMDSYKVTVVDTVGAGDGFDAGYIYGFLHEYSPSELLSFANGVGAMVTTVSGDNEGLPYLEEVKAFINQEKIIDR